MDIWTKCLESEHRAFGPGPGEVVVARPAEEGHRIDATTEAAIRSLADRHLLAEGAILFRGFTVPDEQPLRRFAAIFGETLLDYRFGSTPRTDLGEGIYTSTEYPAHQVIPLHNEQSYTRTWPRRIWFHCVEPAIEGGETPIADSRIVYHRLSAALRDHWASRQLLYVRNYGNGLDLPWEKVFGTTDKAQVEGYCRDQGIRCEWKSDGGLRTAQLCQAVARHPETRDMLWFNQAHLFHVSALDPVVQEALLDIAGDERNLPRNVFYGDGSPIDSDALAEIRSVLAEAEIRFAWQRHDILMLDNMLIMHGRTAFKGPRKVVVAMAGTCSETVTGAQAALV